MSYSVHGNANDTIHIHIHSAEGDCGLQLDIALEHIATLEARVLALTEERERDRDRHHTLTTKLEAERQKVEDAETLLFNMYDRGVMTHNGTRDAWEGFHGAAETIRAAREASSDG